MKIRRISLLGVLAVLVSSFLGTAVSAQAAQINWPVANHGYYCSWSKPDPNNPGSTLYGTAIVTFVNLAGNDYLRRGILRNDYPNGTYSETFVTVTKPVPLTVDNTQFELTTGTGVQCKDFETLFYSTFLHFGQCSNGAVQNCSY
jgi:hypothetical protein